MTGAFLQPARVPFHFNSAAHLLLIGRERAGNLSELLAALRTCSDSSIFEHTFRTLQEHHFIQQGFSNDFAHWAYNDCNEIGLGEKLAGLDVREFTSIDDLRQRIVGIVEEYLRRNPQAEIGRRASRFTSVRLIRWCCPRPSARRTCRSSQPVYGRRL